MGSIADMHDDIKRQAGSLAGFRPAGIPHDIEGSLFCGSGDSLAAAMLAESFSGYGVRAADPRELAANPEIMAGRTAYIVSVSGRTVSNIRVAELADRSVAITARPDSALARACDDIIPLSFENSDVTTAGSISFLNSALTCISLVSPVDLPDAGCILEQALESARSTTVSGRPYILGGLHTYPLAMYAAAKFYEILGVPAAYERIEQFAHMGLFGSDAGDTVIIMEPGDGQDRTDRALAGAGLNVVRPDTGRRGRLEEFLFYTFYAQLLPLQAAQGQGRTECHFMISEGQKRASDGLIY